MMARRKFLAASAGLAAGLTLRAGGRRCYAAPVPPGVSLPDTVGGEGIFEYLLRTEGSFHLARYKQILGAANAFKEGDAIVGVAAADEASRRRARALLAATRVGELDAHPVLRDDLYGLLEQSRDQAAAARTAGMTLRELKQWLLAQEEAGIRSVMPGLSSDVIGCLVKLMSEEELAALGARIFNPLPGSRLGAKGYLGARIQPNSPTDNLDDIRWQVFTGWAYAVGDVVLGTNPVSSDPRSVAAVQHALRDLLVAFGIEEILPHCVLAHVDVQAEVEQSEPGSTALWFQSIAGSDAANATFDISVAKMVGYAAQRPGRFGLYFETGQGADFTNGHGHGYDMVLHESRKYGFARALTQRVADAQRAAGQPVRPWVHLNDVAGFIGPEVFRTREQLVRCCLEDIVMGKLHGLCIGLDVCATLHMDISLDDLDWCLERVMPAHPAYLMALPTKLDPMLGYLTTGYHDHMRLRSQFQRKVDDRVWQFFQDLGVIDERGEPTRHFGDPLGVFVQYCRRKGDTRGESEIRDQGRREMQAVRGRGVFLCEGHGQQAWDLPAPLDQETRRIYADAKECIWAELDPEFIRSLPDALPLRTRSADRSDYILHPETGEQLHEASLPRVRELRERHRGQFNVQVVVSDGLNALAISEPGHLLPFLARLRQELLQAGFRAAPEPIVLTAGRVRAGYRLGEQLFGGLEGPRAVLHLIGERPGTGHRTFSVYLTGVDGAVWGEAGRVDHNRTKVVSGIALTALPPGTAAAETVRLLQTQSKAAPVSN